MAGTNPIVGFWRRGPRTSAFILTLFICSVIFFAHSFGLFSYAAFATILAAAILLCIPVLIFRLSRSFENAAIVEEATDNNENTPRYNAIAWIGSVLGIPIAISASKIVYSISPESIFLPKIALIAFYLAFFIFLFFLYFSDKRKNKQSFVVKVSLPIAVFSASLYLGSDRQFSYLSDIIPDSILNLNVIIREWIFLIAASVLILIGVFNNWAAFQGITNGSSATPPKNQSEKAMRACYDAILYGLEYLKHVLKNITKAFNDTWNLQNLILSFLAFFIMYIGALFASNLHNFDIFIANIIDKNENDVQNLFVLFLLMLWVLIFSICSVWVADHNANDADDFERLDIYSSLNIVMIAFLSIWVFSIIAHVLFAFGLMGSQGFSFPPVSPFFAIGSFVFLFGFLAVGLKFSQNFVGIAMMIGACLGCVVSYGFGASGSSFPFDYTTAPVVKGITGTDRDSSTSNGSWINGFWGIDGTCDSPFEIRLSGDVVTVTIGKAEESLQVASKSDEVVKTSGGTYRKSGNGIEFSAPELPSPQMLTTCAR